VLNIGPAELLVVMVVALLVLGPTKLPDAARQVGRAIGEMRRLSSGFQAEMRDALKEPVDSTPSSASGAPSPSKAIGAGSSPGGTGALSAPRLPASNGQASASGPPAAEPGGTGDAGAADAGGASPESAEPGTDGATTT